MANSTPKDGESNASDSSELSAEIDMGESVEVIIDGNRIEAFLSDNVYIFDPKASIHARMAVRAYAYSLSADDPRAAKDILNREGREG